MSWYTDPELYIFYWNSSYGYWLARITRNYNVYADVEKLDFFKHLFLGNNKESDYDALKSSIAGYSYEANPCYYKCVNFQGLVVYWNYPHKTGTWSRLEDWVFASLPGTTNPSDTKLAEKLQAIERKNSELVEENSILKVELNNAKQALEKQVLDLTAKLQECAGSGFAHAKPWMNGDTAIPSHWVPFDELDVLYLPKNLPVIMEELSMPKFVADATTNVQVNHFHRGTSIVAVNVEVLSPGGERARFDPEFWGVYTNAGIHYAARKPLKSEMSVSPPHKTS